MEKKVQWVYICKYTYICMYVANKHKVWKCRYSMKYAGEKFTKCHPLAANVSCGIAEDNDGSYIITGGYNWQVLMRLSLKNYTEILFWILYLLLIYLCFYHVDCWKAGRVLIGNNFIDTVFSFLGN